MANIFKRKTLRDKCRDLYGDDFVFRYDLLCSGVPIGSMDETISFLKDIEAAQKVSNKTRRRLKKDKLLYDEGFHDGKRDAMKWISVKERLPEKGTQVLAWIKDENEPYPTVGSFDGDEREIGVWRRWVTHWMPLPAPPEVTDDGEAAV